MTSNIVERWRSATPATRGVVVVIGLVAAVNLTLFGIKQIAGGEPGGRASSSYATAPDGVGAYAELLARNGHPVSRIRTAPSEQVLDPMTTVVVLDPFEILPEDGRSLRAFLEGGGRLVASEGFATPWLGDLLDDPPTIGESASGIARPLLPIFPGVQRVRHVGQDAWNDVGETEAALGDGEHVLVAFAEVGSGSVVLLADTSPLKNKLLDQADNAAFGLALAGEPGRTVQFLETVHGYGTSQGLGALPAQWRWSLAGLGAAALVYMVARGRRLGPPEEEARSLPPPRRAYVDSLAATLVKTNDPSAAAAPIRSAVRDNLALRTGLSRSAYDAGAGDDAAYDDELRTAATRIGIDPAVIEAALSTVTSNDDLLAVGAALARLTDSGTTDRTERQLCRNFVIGLRPRWQKLSSARKK